MPNLTEPYTALTDDPHPSTDVRVKRVPGKLGRAGGFCRVCLDARRAEIEAALVVKSISEVRAEFHTGTQILRNHRANHMTAAAAEIRRAREVARAKVLAGEDAEEQAKIDLARYRTIESLMDRIIDQSIKVYDAIDEYLTDPENPDKYTLDTHASEVQVIWEQRDEEYFRESGNERWTRVKGSLQDAINAAFPSSDRRLWRKTPAKFHDPRKMASETAATLLQTVDQMAKLEGRYRPVEKALGEGGTIQLSVIQNILVEVGMLKR